MNIFLRLLTIACYFLPLTFFVATCNGPGFHYAYNKAEAEKNEQQERLASESVQDPGAIAAPMLASALDTLADTVATEATAPEKRTDISDIIRKGIFPTESSLSGAGALIYFRNVTGRVLMDISLLLTLWLLFVRSGSRLRGILLPLQLLCLAAFVIDALCSSVTLLWGVAPLLALPALQWLRYLWQRKPAGT